MLSSLSVAFGTSAFGHGLCGTFEFKVFGGHLKRNKGSCLLKTSSILGSGFSGLRASSLPKRIRV